MDSDPAVVIETVWDVPRGPMRLCRLLPTRSVPHFPVSKYPGALPPGTAHVTSQIVYGVSTGRLTNAYVAAFGFWKSEPYVSSCSVSHSLELK